VAKLLPHVGDLWTLCHSFLGDYIIAYEFRRCCGGPSSGDLHNVYNDSYSFYSCIQAMATEAHCVINNELPAVFLHRYKRLIVFLFPYQNLDGCLQGLKGQLQRSGKDEKRGNAFLNRHKEVFA